MKIRWTLGLLGIATVVTLAAAQEIVKDRFQRNNPSYDGRYAFVRIRYTIKPGDACTAPPPQGPGWHHDYPLAERALMELTTHLTRLDGRTDSTLLLTVDDPELMKYPIAYLTEPACWRLSDAEVKGLRTYLLKGGFLIVDDFTIGRPNRTTFEESRKVFEEQILRAIPGGKVVPIPASDPVFNGIFGLNPEKLFPSMTAFDPSLRPEFHGVYEDNDPSKRLLVAANYNNDINQYWHMTARGFKAVDVTNTAYKMGINYLIYGFLY